MNESPNYTHICTTDVPAAICFLAVRAFYAAGTRCKALVVSCPIPWIHDKRLGAYWQSSMEHVDKAWMHNWAAVAYSAYRLYVTVARIWVSSINAKLLCIQRQPIQQTLRWMTGCQPKAAKDASTFWLCTSSTNAYQLLQYMQCKHKHQGTGVCTCMSLKEILSLRNRLFQNALWANKANLCMRTHALYGGSQVSISVHRL